MTATTITTTPTPTALAPVNSATGFFMLDSGSLLSVTNCITEIINPIKLTAPIPIPITDPYWSFSRYSCR